MPIVFSPDQVTAQVEQTGYSSIGTQESLRLTRRLESSHTSLSNPSRLMRGAAFRLLGPIIFILLSAVDCLRNQLPMSDTIAP